MYERENEVKNGIISVKEFAKLNNLSYHKAYRYVKNLRKNLHANNENLQVKNENLHENLQVKNENFSENSENLQTEFENILQSNENIQVENAISEQQFASFWSAIDGILSFLKMMNIIEYENLTQQDISELVQASKGTYIEKLISLGGNNINNLLVLGVVFSKFSTRIRFKKKSTVNANMMKETIENTQNSEVKEISKVNTQVNTQVSKIDESNIPITLANLM